MNEIMSNFREVIKNWNIFCMLKKNRYYSKVKCVSYSLSVLNCYFVMVAVVICSDHLYNI